MSGLGIQLALGYIGAHLLLVVAATLLAGLRAFGRCSTRPLSYRHLLLAGRLLAIGALCLPLLAVWQGGTALSPVRAQVWSAASMYAGAAALSPGGQLEVGLSSAHALLSVAVAATAVAGLFGGGLLLTLLRLVPEARATFRAIHAAHCLRSIGSIRLLVSDRDGVPFAAWIPRRCFIVVPAALLLRPVDLRLALRHELQHHRQRDTQYLYAALIWRALFGINPALHWMLRQLTELQELACDEALARRASHRPERYCACLLRIAESAAPRGRVRLRACMSSRDRGSLAHRIETVMRGCVLPLGAPTAAAIILSAVALLAGLSALSAVPVADWRMSRAEAERLAAGAPAAAAGEPLINDSVLRQLNLLLGTPDGRTFLTASIARMHRYEPSLLTQLGVHGLPPQLLAVPLVESGYRNLPPRPGVGAGLWMFIAPTARRYGLQISGQGDQRLDIPAETGAAMHMLSDLWRQFRNWPLALMAYNSGSSRVEAGIHATGSRDAWRLYRAGYGNDPDYLARTMAVMLILAQPRLPN